MVFFTKKTKQVILIRYFFNFGNLQALLHMLNFMKRWEVVNISTKPPLRVRCGVKWIPCFTRLFLTYTKIKINQIDHNWYPRSIVLNVVVKVILWRGFIRFWFDKILLFGQMLTELVISKSIWDTQFVFTVPWFDYIL